MGKGEGTKVFGNILPLGFDKTRPLTVEYHGCAGSGRDAVHSSHLESIHRVPRTSHTPGAFLSEQWLSTGARAPAGEHNTAGFLPFSYGAIKYVEKDLVLTELRVLSC